MMTKNAVLIISDGENKRYDKVYSYHIALQLWLSLRDLDIHEVNTYAQTDSLWMHQETDEINKYKKFIDKEIDKYKSKGFNIYVLECHTFPNKDKLFEDKPEVSLVKVSNKKSNISDLKRSLEEKNIKVNLLNEPKSSIVKNALKKEVEVSVIKFNDDSVYYTLEKRLNTSKIIAEHIKDYFDKKEESSNEEFYVGNMFIYASVLLISAIYIFWNYRYDYGIIE